MSRIRANQITNQSADGAPTVQNGLVISGVTTSTTFSGSGANLTNLNGSNIASGTVPVARIGTGTKNTSTFYRGDGSFATVTSTTINNNADNRIITGSGTANTLEGEATLTFTNSGSAGQVNLKRSTSTDQEAIFYYGSSNLEIETREATGIKLKTNKSDRATLTSTGNFGLATNSPVAQTLAGGTAITPVLDLKGTSQNNTSGVLQFTRKDNSTQGSCIYSSGDDAGLTFRNTDGNGFGFYNGTTLSLRINPSGQITQPTQPSFSAHYSVNSGWSVSNGSVMNFNTTRHNTGSHYSTSNYRFTAPVNGHYEFAFYSIYNTDLNNTQNGAVNMRVNGGTVSKGGRCHFTKDGTSWDHVSYSVVYYLNASDYVDIVNDGGQTINYHGGSWSGFTGQLIS